MKPASKWVFFCFLRGFPQDTGKPVEKKFLFYKKGFPSMGAFWLVFDGLNS